MFQGKCIEFHTAERRVPLNEARNICEDRGGRLVGRGLKRHGLHFLAWRAAKLFGQDPFWLDASSNQGVWTWDDSQDVCSHHSDIVLFELKSWEGVLA